MVIVGGTGVGKSTWINAFANYMAFNSLEEAKQNPLFPIPPSSTSTTVHGGDIRVRTLGDSDDNERGSSGSGSSTMMPKIYKFRLADDQLYDSSCVGAERMEMDDMTVNIIDTPGISDTRGPEQDDLNIEATFDALRCSDELNAVCIVMKNDVTRLTEEVKVQLNMLLENLHENIRNNIIFCFTRSNDNDFKPGESLTTLRSFWTELKISRPLELNDKTVYCVDNFPVNFLLKICSSSDVPTDREKIRAEECWNESRRSIIRMMTHIRSLPPYPVFNTLSVYDTKRMACIVAIVTVEMVKAMLIDIGELRRAIVKMTEKKESISRFPLDRYEERAMLFEGIEVFLIKVVAHRLPTPTTKCKTLACEGRECKGKELKNFTRSLFVQSDEDRIKICSECKCCYENHEWVACRLVHERVKFFKERAAQKELPVSEALKNFDEKINYLKERVSNVEVERGKFVSACARMSGFVQTQSILKRAGQSGCNSQSDFIAHLFEKEIKDLSMSTKEADRELLRHMQDIVETYKKTRDKIRGQTCTASDIRTVVNEMNELPLKGKELKDAVDAYFDARDKGIANCLSTTVELRRQCRPQTPISVEESQDCNLVVDDE